MARWSSVARDMAVLALVACTPFTASTDPSDPDDAPSNGDPDAKAPADGGRPVGARPDAGNTPSDPCTGTFFCDDFERATLGGGPIPWEVHVAGGALLAIEPRAGRGGGLVARSDANGNDAILSATRPLPSGGATGLTVRLTYEVLDDGCSGGGYTDLMQVVVKGTGYMNVNLGNDCELHISFGCEGREACDDWVPFLKGGRTRGRVHELVFGARLGGASAEGFYALDGVGEESPIGLQAPTSNAPPLFVALGVDQADGRTGVIGIRYEHVSVTLE